MLDVVKIEWLKYRRYRTFWILNLLFFGLLLAFYSAVTAGVIIINPNGINIVGRARSFAQVWDDLTFYASYFVIILSILVIILNTNEIQFRTNRQNIIDGWTRLEFYHVKWVTVAGLSAAVSIFVLIVGLLTGLSSGLMFSTFFDHSEKIIWLFLLSLNYLGFALALSLWLKKSGLTIGILMFYSMMIEMTLHFIFLFKYKAPAGDLFLPLQASDELLPASASQLIRAGMGNVPPAEIYALATCGWIIVYYIVGRYRIMKKDW